MFVEPQGLKTRETPSHQMCTQAQTLKHTTHLVARLMVSCLTEILNYSRLLQQSYRRPHPRKSIICKVTPCNWENHSLYNMFLITCSTPRDIYTRMLLTTKLIVFFLNITCFRSSREKQVLHLVIQINRTKIWGLRIFSRSFKICIPTWLLG